MEERSPARALLGRASLLAARLVPDNLKPRLSVFRQYGPRPVRLPASYSTETTPSPTPTVSIVTPSLNQGHFIEATIASVLDQHYPALEYVVQDGGSTDSTVQILQRYGSRLASWRSEPDRGAQDAINRAFARTSGEIMAYLNADDMLLPGTINYVVRYFNEHPDVDVVYGHRIVVDDNGDEVGRWVMPAHDDDVIRWVDYLPQETMFWRRRTWESSGARIAEEFALVYDWDLILRFLDAGARFVRLPRFLAAVRSHAARKSERDLERGEVECANLRTRYFGRTPSQGEIAAAVRRYQLKHLALHLAMQLKLVRT